MNITRLIEKRGFAPAIAKLRYTETDRSRTRGPTLRPSGRIRQPLSLSRKVPKGRTEWSRAAQHPRLCTPASRRTTPLTTTHQRDFKDACEAEKDKIVRENVAQTLRL